MAAPERSHTSPSSPSGTGRPSASWMRHLDSAPGPPDGEEGLGVGGVEGGAGAHAPGLGGGVADGVAGAEAAAWPPPPAPGPRARRRRRGPAPTRGRARRRWGRAAAGRSGGRPRRASRSPTRSASSSTSAARHRPRRWVVVPVRRYHASLVVKPTWAIWVAASIGRGWGVGVAPGQAGVDPGDGLEVAVAEDRPLRVPGGARGEHDVGQPFGVVDRRGDGASGARAAPGPRPPRAAATTRAGRARSTQACRSAGARRGFTPAVAAPALAAPAVRTTHSTPDGRVRATRSPGPRPRDARAAATPSERRSSSA